MPQIVIASGLADGRVVFLAPAEEPGQVRWARLIGEAELATNDARAEELLALAEQDAGTRHEVVDPYLIDVEQASDGLRPTKYREVIRCLGPTIRLDLGKQSEGASA